MTEWNFGRDVMDRWAQERPDDTGLYLVTGQDHAGHRRVSFEELRQVSNRLVQRFRDEGVKAGDHVLVILGKHSGFWPAMLALIKLGAVPMPGTTQLTARDIRYRLELAESSRILTIPEVAARLVDDAETTERLTWRTVVGQGAPAGWSTLDPWPQDGPTHDSGNPTQESDPCLLYFTSGTTGHAKMVLHDHSYPRAHRITGIEWIGLRPNDVHWNLSDTGWAKAAWSSLFGPWMAGATIVVDNMEGRFDAPTMLDILSRHPISSLCAAPTIYRMVVQEDLSRWAFPHLRTAVGAGEPLNPEVIESFRAATGLTIRDGYGQTETVLIVGNCPGTDVKPGSMGKPIPGFDVDVIDDNGSRLPPGREGDIAISLADGRPPGLMVGYWKDAEETSSRFRQLPGGAWYLTGDRAVKDGGGYLWFVGRADDVIKSAGYRIGPFEVESALLEHALVVEAAAVAAPDPIRGQVVKAFIVLKAGTVGSPALVKELQQHVQEVTAPYKYPRLIEFVTELPKTISGKIRRVELREREWRGS